MIEDGAPSPLPTPLVAELAPAPGAFAPAPGAFAPAPGAFASAAGPRPAAAAVSVSLTSVDPPVVAEYAELTPGSTGPVVTALSEGALVAELRADEEFAAQAEAAASRRLGRVDEVA